MHLGYQIQRRPDCIYFWALWEEARWRPGKHESKQHAHMNLWPNSEGFLFTRKPPDYGAQTSQLKKKRGEGRKNVFPNAYIKTYAYENKLFPVLF